jgi:hypothetical protein
VPDPARTINVDRPPVNGANQPIQRGAALVDFGVPVCVEEVMVCGERVVEISCRRK